MLVTEALDSVPITAAITGRLQPGGSLLLEVQGQSDLAMAERQAAKLAGTMDKAKGASQRTSYATVCEGVSAGIAALTAWHNGQAVEGGEGQARLVCWRAVESSMSADTLGDPTPSEADIKVTRDLIRAGQLLKIEVLDHVILGRSTQERPQDYVSLRALGYFL